MIQLEDIDGHMVDTYSDMRMSIQYGFRLEVLLRLRDVRAGDKLSAFRCSSVDMRVCTGELSRW